MDGFTMRINTVEIILYVLLGFGIVGTAFTSFQVLLGVAFLRYRSVRNVNKPAKIGERAGVSKAAGADTAGISLLCSAPPCDLPSGRTVGAVATPVRPRVSIIKPVSGIEDGLEMNLASFANLAGPSYELIISIAEPDDPALPIIEKVLPLFVEGTVRVIIGGASRMDNPKVERLVAGARRAAGDILLISDSNVKVSRDYLVMTMREFEDPGVGCTVNLFVGDQAVTPGANLECLYILTFVLPGTILAALAGVTCVVGKSMAVTRTVLEQIGGFEAFARVLAEDQSIGLAVERAGYRVALSPVVVHNVIEKRTVAGAIKRQVRWGKIRYSFSRLRYTAEFLCNPLPILVAASILSGAAGLSAPAPILLIGSAVAVRVLQAATMKYMTGARLPAWSLALVPAQDCLQAVTQFIPYFSKHVDWRGFRTRLGRDTQILEPRHV